MAAYKQNVVSRAAMIHCHVRSGRICFICQNRCIARGFVGKASERPFVIVAEGISIIPACIFSKALITLVGFILIHGGKLIKIGFGWKFALVGGTRNGMVITQQAMLSQSRDVNACKTARPIRFNEGEFPIRLQRGIVLEGFVKFAHVVGAG